MTPSYHKNGVYVADNALDLALINAALEGAIEVTNGNYDTGVPPWGALNLNDNTKLQRVLQVHLASRKILKLLKFSRIGKVAAELTQSTTIKIWGTQLYIKPKNTPQSVVGFHRDYQHMPYFSSGVLTAWIPLTEIVEQAGPLIYITGSHNWQNSLPSSGGQVESIKEQKEKLKLESQNESWSEYSAVIPRGSVCFHNKDTLHGSEGNSTEHDRFALAVGLLTDQMTIDKNCDDFGYGENLENEDICPILYNQD